MHTKLQVVIARHRTAQHGRSTVNTSVGVVFATTKLVGSDRKQRLTITANDLYEAFCQRSSVAQFSRNSPPSWKLHAIYGKGYPALVETRNSQRSSLIHFASVNIGSPKIRRLATMIGYLVAMDVLPHPQAEYVR